MEDYFETTDELPSVRLISRDDFAEENFDVDEFLTRIHKYQTLEDLKQQLKSWDETLANELNDTVNDNYPAFMDLGKSLTGGEGVIGDIKVEVRSFQSSLAKLKQGLDHSGKECQDLLQEYVHLASLETDASMLLALSRQLTDLETHLGDSHSGDSDTLPSFSVQELEQIVKSLLLVQRWASMLKKYPIQAVYRIRIVQRDNQVEKLLKAALLDKAASPQDKAKILDLYKMFYVGRKDS